MGTRRRSLRLARTLLAVATNNMTPRTAPLLHKDLADFLVEYGFGAHDLEASGLHGLTPLMRAALLGRLDILEALLERDVAVNARNDDGNNALWLACVAGSPDAVRRLVSAGIDVDNRNETGATALMYAASAGKDDMVALLLALGANPRLHNQDGASALDMAASYGCLTLLRHVAP